MPREIASRVVSDAIIATMNNPDMGIEWMARPYGSCFVINGEEDRSAEVASTVLISSSFIEVTEKLPEGLKSPLARYFRFAFPEGCIAYEKVILLGDLTDEELSTVRIIRSEHQDGLGNRLEFISDIDVSRIKDYGHVILGPSQRDSNETVVWSWFPGDVTPYVDSRLCTVKLK